VAVVEEEVVEEVAVVDQAEEEEVAVVDLAEEEVAVAAGQVAVAAEEDLGAMAAALSVLVQPLTFRCWVPLQLPADLIGSFSAVALRCGP
jgi:hypothetical protein